MDSDAASNIFRSIVYGKEADRNAAIAALNDQANPVDHSRLRLLILDALKREFYPGREKLEQDESLVWTRSWLLNTLGRICDSDAEAARVVRSHLDPQYEPAYWVRYWILDSLVAAGAPDLKELAEKVAAQEEEPLVGKLGEAILASKGDAAAWKKIEDGLMDPKLQWATLRALRIVPIPAMFHKINNIVDTGEYSDATYDAIIALSKAPRSSAHAERAARSLGNFIAQFRRSPLRDGMRTVALRALGSLRVESVAPLLVEELTDDNPGVAREAAVALKETVGIRTAAARVVEAAGKAGPDRIEGFARALRWMDRASAVEELESVMISGSPEHQDVARLLISEVGGAVAFQKLRARTTAIAQYTSEMEKAEEKIRNLFEASIKEARTGFKISALMDMIVFFLGLGLLGVSAGLVLSRGGTLDSWVGVGLTSGIGVFGVLYGILIARPRHQILEAVDHLMYLKVIFLSYLRQLHQADQAYTRRLLEDKPLPSEEVHKFSSMVEATMRIAIQQLHAIRAARGRPKLKGPKPGTEAPSGGEVKTEVEVQPLPPGEVQAQ